jgi:hypothetical protein
MESQRNRLTKIKVDEERGQGECHFCSLRHFREIYNRWCPDDEDRKWTKHTDKGEGKGRCSVYARVVQFDHSLGKHKDANPWESHRTKEGFYVLCDATDNVETVGMVKRGV